MKTITLTDYAALKISAFQDAAYTERMKADVCDAFCTLVQDADQSYTTPQMNVLLVLQEFADLITAISESKDK